MTSAPALSAPHTAGVLAHMQTAGILVGRAIKPTGAGWQGTPGNSQFKGYAVLYPQPGTPEGTLGDRYSDLLYTFQVTAVGASEAQATQVGDLVRAAVLGSPPAVTGRVVQPVWQLAEQPVMRDDDESPSLFYTVVQYRMRTEPA